MDLVLGAKVASEAVALMGFLFLPVTLPPLLVRRFEVRFQVGNAVVEHRRRVGSRKGGERVCADLGNSQGGGYAGTNDVPRMRNCLRADGPMAKANGSRTDSGVLLKFRPNKVNSARKCPALGQYLPYREEV